MMVDQYSFQNNYNGWTTIITMVTEDGYRIKTFYSGYGQVPDKGLEYILTATVKKDEMYQEMFSTVVTRSKWVAVEKVSA
jgi:hypothetical protein